MNLEESNLFVEEEQKNSKRKKSVLISIGVCAILVALLLVLIVWIKSEDAKTLKMFVNNTQVGITNTFFTESDGETYVNVKEFAEMLGYTYTKGEYGKYNEDDKCCYLTNDYEIVALNSGESQFTKYAETTGVKLELAEIAVNVKSQKGQSQRYSLEKPILYLENGIYVPFSASQDIFNAKVDLSTPNRIRISSFETIIANAKTAIASLPQYTTISGDYENLKAMVYNYAVVGDGTYFGVISLETGKEILSLKYEDITFLPNSQDFLIKASSTVGILAADGSTVISPTEYDEISVYDDANQLYLVKKDNKYGILNRKGSVIIFADYSEIGFSKAKDFEFVEETGDYKIFFDKAIPVKDGAKYGLYSIDGQELLSSVYDSFLADERESQTAGEKTVVTIPESIGIKGIVVKQNDMYGIYDVEAEKIVIPCVCTNIYSITKTAKTTYYLDYSGQTIELEQYLKDNNLVSVVQKKDDKKEAEDESSNTTNTVLDNQTENQTQNETTNTESVVVEY